MTLVHLMRHGETEWNAAGRLQGQADIPLSDKGRAQVRAQRDAMRPDTMHCVASDLSRAVETAQIMGFDEPRRDRRLREINVGSWEGREVRGLLAEDERAYRDWRSGRHTPAGGEQWTDFCDRVLVAFDEHAGAAAAEGRDLVLVCHGGVVRAVLDALLGLSPDSFAASATASLSSILLHSPPVLVTYNTPPPIALRLD